MQQYVDEKIEAWRVHGEQFACAHEQTALRKRAIKGGQIQYVQQCSRCGESKNQPVAKARALELSGGVEPAPFDSKLRETWEQRRRESAEEIKARFSRSAFFADYDQYLKSDAWASRRVLVFKRSRGVCEGCGEQPPTEVHHLSYEHVGKEFLFELVALCHGCHERLHEEAAPE